MSTIVTLDDVTHTYTDNYGKTYLSVSKFIELFTKKFDREGISRMSANKKGISQSEILAEWDKKRDDSIDHGNRLHNALELYQKTTEVKPENEYLYPTIKSICSEYSQYYRVFPEEIIFSEEHLIAGKTDNRFQHTSSPKSIISFGDYKTNLLKGIQTENKYGQYMLGPLSHLQDCNFIRYTIQASTYAYLHQEKTGCKIGSLHILFIPPDNYLAWRKIYVPYMKSDVINMIAYYKSIATPIEQIAKPKSVLNNSFGNTEFLNEGDLM